MWGEMIEPTSPEREGDPGGVIKGSSPIPDPFFDIEDDRKEDRGLELIPKGDWRRTMGEPEELEEDEEEEDEEDDEEEEEKEEEGEYEKDGMGEPLESVEKDQKKITIEALHILFIPEKINCSLRRTHWVLQLSKTSKQSSGNASNIGGNCPWPATSGAAGSGRPCSPPASPV
ncbi:hypothetical protein BY996DRAFT_6518404 [Phakopsora pachyrhizi]|nr:hypothetical protein BY996DRAFT_6518404 [Phakopsora pachyrhizi]